MKAFEVLTNLKGFDCWDFKNYSLSKEEATTIIELLEKPKGKWETGYTFPDGDYWKCSHCNELIKVKIPMKFCSNCGADMREDEE